MADKKISDFTAVTTLADGDLFELETAGGNSRKITKANLKAALGGTFRGALVKKSTNQTTANYSAGVAVAWDAEAYDTDTIHDNSTNNTRLTVPSGVSYVRLKAQANLDLVTAGSDTYYQITKNGSATYDGFTQVNLDLQSIAQTTAPIASPVLAVTAGDYFEFKVFCADTSVTVLANGSWFAMEIVE